MSGQSSVNDPEKQKLLDALQTARDTARVQAHLFSLEAKERWRGLEERLLSTERVLVQSGESIAEGIASTVGELVNSVKEIVEGIDLALESPLPIRTVMTKDPAVCSPHDSLSRAAQIMWEVDCGAVPVVDDGGRLVGMITDRDICMATHTRGRTPSSIDVESTMAKTVHVASPSDSIARVAHIMGRYQVRRIPVVEDGRLVGIVSLADLARYVLHEESANSSACVTLARTLGNVSERRETPAARDAAE